MPGKITASKLIIWTASAAGGAALLAVLTTGVPGGDSSPPAEPRGPASMSLNAASGTGDESRFFLPESGYRYIYNFRRGISFSGNLGGAGMPPVDFKGEFYVDVLRADARSFEAIVGERIESAPSPRAPFVRVEADARGDQVSVFTGGMRSEEEKQHAQVVKDLVALWLFPLRSDTVGAFDARFEPMVAETGFARERKSKIAYVSRAPNTPAILSSQHFLLWNFALHLPSEVKGVESTRLGHGPTALVAESRYELRYRTRERSPGFDHALLSTLQDRDALALDTTHPNMADHPDYARLDWSKLMVDLKGIDKLTGMEQLNLFGDIVKFLRLHPGKSSELADILRDPALLKLGADSPLFRNIVGALATFASPEALAALRDAYDDPHLAASGKGTILAALTTTQGVIDATTREFLAQKMQSEQDARLAQSAAYALGSSLQNALNDEQTTRSIAQIEQGLGAARGTAAQIAMLDVIGNSGRSEFLPDLESMIQSDAASNVKARAIYALRFIKTPAATQDLIAGLSSVDTAVREAAAGAIGVADWSETYRPPLEKCSSAESVTRIQDSCRKTLSSNARVAASN